MKYIIFILFTILGYLSSKSIGNETKIDLMSYTFMDDFTQNDTTKDEFNEYAKKNNLTISLDIELTRLINPSDSYANFRSFVESSIKKSNKASINDIKTYEVYIYDSRYTNIYAPYLMDLNDNLPKEIIEKFNSKVINETCIYESKEGSKIAGLPAFVSYEVLYSNKELLKKYNKPIPKTWDELIDICKYIMDKENDPELICYNGFFDEIPLTLLIQIYKINPL